MLKFISSNYPINSNTRTNQGVKKGCLICEADPSLSFAFQYNPTSLPYGISNNLLDATGPSIMYPDVIFGGRSSQIYEFELFLNSLGDSDETREKLGVSSKVAIVEKQLEILDRLSGSKSNVVQYSSNFGDTYYVSTTLTKNVDSIVPYVIKLSFGRILVSCVIQSYKVSPEKYYKDLRIARARVALTVRRIR